MTAPRLPFVNVPPKRPSLDDIFNERPSLDDVFNDRPTVKAAASDMTQTKATTKNVTGRPNDWAGAARTVGQGLTGGFGDEMEAGARRLLTGEPYDQSVQRIRENLGAFKQENPGTAFALEAVGAIAPGALVGKALGGAKMAANVKEAAKTAAQAGAITGGVTGIGTGTNWRERVTGGALGSILGGAVGGAAGAAGQKVANAVARRKVPTADRIVLDAMDADQIDPAQARQMLTDVPLTREVSIADLGGDATRRLAGTSTLVPTKEGARLRDVMQARTLEGGKDFADLLESTSGVTRENVNTAQAAMKAARKASSGPLFEAAAKSGPVADPRLAQLVGVSPEAQRAYQAMQVAAQRRQIPVPSLDEFMAGQPLDARAAHWWKLEMDGIAGAAKKQASGSNPMGMTTTTAAQIKQDAGALRDVLADVIPDYGNALKTYADASKTMKAYRAGLKGGTRMGDVEAMPQFVNAKAEDVAAFMASLSPEEQAAYRAGSVQDVMRNTEDGTAAAKRVTRMLGNPTESGKYRQLFAPDATGDDAFAKFVAGGKVQRNQRLTEEEVIGSAKTAARQEAQRALTGDEPLTEQAAKSGIRQALESRFWRWLAQRRLGEAAGGVAERLTPMQRQQVEDLLASLAKFQTLRAGANPSLRAFGNAGALIGSGTGRTPR